MSLSDVGKMCLFSEISGVVTFEGKPVVQAKMKRVVRKAHSQAEKVDETTTDNRGYFKMPAVYDRSIAGKILPMEFSVPQQIFVYVDEKEYEIWSGVKRKREENSESSGNPLVVKCELSGEQKIVSVSGGFVSSLCTWDFTPDAPLVIDLPEEDED